MPGVSGRNFDQRILAHSIVVPENVFSHAACRHVIGALLGDVQVVVSWGRRAVDALALLTVITVGAVLAAVITFILDITFAVTAIRVRNSLCGREHMVGKEGVIIPLLRAARAVTAVTARIAIAVVVAVAVTTVILTRRGIATARRRRAATTARRAATVAVAARVEPPRGGRRGACPLRNGMSGNLATHRKKKNKPWVPAWNSLTSHSPRSSGCRHGQDACYACHGTHHRHHDGPRIRRTQN